MVSDLVAILQNSYTLCVKKKSGNRSGFFSFDYFTSLGATTVVWPCLPFIRSGQNHLARHSEKGKKTMQAEEEVGRQHQGMGRPGVRQVPEGSGEHRENEETGLSHLWCPVIKG